MDVSGARRLRATCFVMRAPSVSLFAPTTRKIDVMSGRFPAFPMASAHVCELGYTTGGYWVATSSDVSGAGGGSGGALA